MTNTAIGIVIPYYQRESGILARALRSVAGQRGVEDVRVVVVDDSSPIPAAGEVEEVGDGFPLPLEVITQANGGPGAARNRALDAWVGNVRLSRFSIPMMNGRKIIWLALYWRYLRGFDVYFADLLHLGAEVSAFRRAGRINPADHPMLAGTEGLYAYHGDMLEQILFGNVIGTSTVVYDTSRFPAIRFRPEFHNAGEDYLFWLDLTHAGA
ncbi:MAG: glycosyltransferase [Candidatus Competibacteraceae bacterium]|nr:glycosyltransferase [Candidatus Competibacteraceae bacterium]